MKQKTQKTLAVLLSAAVALSMTAPVFAKDANSEKSRANDKSKQMLTERYQPVLTDVDAPDRQETQEAEAKASRGKAEVRQLQEDVEDADEIKGAGDVDEVKKGSKAIKKVEDLQALKPALTEFRAQQQETREIRNQIVHERNLLRQQVQAAKDQSNYEALKVTLDQAVVLGDQVKTLEALTHKDKTLWTQLQEDKRSGDEVLVQADMEQLKAEAQARIDALKAILATLQQINTDLANAPAPVDTTPTTVEPAPADTPVSTETTMSADASGDTSISSEVTTNVSIESPAESSVEVSPAVPLQ